VGTYAHDSSSTAGARVLRPHIEPCGEHFVHALKLLAHVLQVSNHPLLHTTLLSTTSTVPSASEQPLPYIPMQDLLLHV
jgi:hypothetical protein